MPLIMAKKRISFAQCHKGKEDNHPMIDAKDFKTSSYYLTVNRWKLVNRLTISKSNSQNNWYKKASDWMIREEKKGGNSI